jgi:hypothetical protein
MLQILPKFTSAILKEFLKVTTGHSNSFWKLLGLDIFCYTDSSSLQKRVSNATFDISNPSKQ